MGDATPKPANEDGELIKAWRQRGEPAHCCPVCETPWEGFKANHGSTNEIYLHGYPLQTGGHDVTPDKCAACGALDCAPHCPHHQPDWEAIYDSRLAAGLDPWTDEPDPKLVGRDEVKQWALARTLRRLAQILDPSHEEA